MHAWRNVADTLDLQGEVVLAGEVRSFARHLPIAQTDNEELAERVARFLGVNAPKPEHVTVRTR